MLARKVARDGLIADDATVESDVAEVIRHRLDDVQSRVAQIPVARHEASPHPPGPNAIRSLMAILGAQGGAPLRLQDLARKYPKLAHMRVGSEHLYVLNDPDLIWELYQVNGRHTVKARLIQQIRVIIGDGLLVSEGQVHKSQRRMMEQAFRKDRLEAYAQTMVEETAEHIEQWQDGQRVNMTQDMGNLTFKIVGKTLFGTDVSDSSGELSQALDQVTGYFSTRAARPWASRLLTTSWPPARRTALAIETMDRVIDRLIDERRSEPHGPDLLSAMIADESTDMATSQLRDEIITLALAGHETTALALTWAWYLLARNPAAGQRMRAEVGAVLAGRLPTLADTADLPFTQAVLHESLRLFPPAWLRARVVTADVQLDEWLIPRGSTILASQFVLHRDPRWWGSDAARFVPDRWLTADGSFSAEAPGQPRAAFFPFGFGARKCIGDRFAMNEALLLLATVSQRFSPGLASDQPPGFRTGATLRPARPVEMRLRKVVTV